MQFLDGCRPMCIESAFGWAIRSNVIIQSLLCLVSFSSSFLTSIRRCFGSPVHRAKGQEINPARVTLLFLFRLLFPFGRRRRRLWVGGWLTGPERESDADGGRSNSLPEMLLWM